MSRQHSSQRSRITAALTAVAVVATGLLVAAAPAAVAATPNVVPSPATAVTADALPTTQIDGVAWDQEIVGDTVYVVGKFTNARPAGAAPGTNQVTRNNILAYDIRTGQLSTTFNPSLNNQASVVAKSPDGKRVYVGGNFTQVGGTNRYRIAAFDTATGALITTFAPQLDYTVKAIAATNSTVYVAGAFSKSGSQARSRFAAFNAANGALLPWAPSADATVNALTLTPDGSALIAGGAFENVNGSPAYGLAKIDSSSGALIPWAAGDTVRNAGANSAILSLTTDGTSVFGTGYHFGAGGNLEGTFSADPTTGAVNWVEDCHGDTYDAWAGNGTVYTVSHAHYCGNLGGFPQSDPWSINMRRALAFTSDARTTLGHDPWGYFDWFGTPAPSMLSWFPELDAGSFTGKTQAAWSVTGNDKYVVMGGEFPRVNGVGQQGLVRFAIPSIAPKKVGPSLSGSQINPTMIGLPSGTVRVSWTADSDKDDKTLTYRLTRNGTQVFQTTADSTFWDRPAMGYLDTGVAPGSVVKYRLIVADKDGNTVQSDIVNFTAPASGAQTAYAQRVLADGAAPYWPLNEPSGTAVYDNGGFTDATASGDLVRGVSGAVTGDAASTFGNGVTASTTNAVNSPNTFSAQAWIKTTTTSGGKILGFGNQVSTVGQSGSYDRHVYMDNDGRIFFGVYPGDVRTVNSSPGYNDGQWHQITATLGPDGMRLFIDGRQIAQRSDTTSGQDFAGYWRVGGDNIGGWPNQPASSTFNGTIDEVAIYPTVLTRATVDAQWVASGRASTIPAAPADPYGAMVFSDNPALYWRLDESTGSVARDFGPDGEQTGLYLGGVAQGATGGIKGTTDTAASFDGVNGLVSSAKMFSNPRDYSLEAWFKTTTTDGGKIIGFGCNQTGQSGCYDRHVYLSNDGRLTFGVWTGMTNTITTPNAVNDGVWHHVVASQSSSTGMKLYLDGQLVGVNGQTDAQAYDGFWKVGGDSHWGCCSAYLAGTIDDVAVYNGALGADRVAAHFATGSTVEPPNQAPTASFTATANQLTVGVDAGASSDADGTIATYRWDFGDGTVQTTTTPTSSHVYAAAGPKTIGLTVTDDRGATASTTRSVTVTAPPANQAPTAAFVVTPAQLTVTVDGSTSTDPEGPIAAYRWDFGDGTVETTTTPTKTHTYATAGTRTVTLTVTDGGGATATTSQPVQVTAPPPNTAPTAAFTAETDGLTVNLASTSTDQDGTVVAWSWDFGDGTPATTDSTATHAYASAGTRTVTLTVTDDDGATATTTRSVTVTAPPPVNQAPTAAFTSTSNGLSAAFTSTSSDPDGSITAWAWDFGDNSNTMATTTSAAHTYATAGTYQVTLTVTDDGGKTATVTQPVTVSAPAPTALAADTFGRTVTNGWGTADTGGGWTVAGGGSNFSVNGGTGRIRLAAAGSGPSASLGALASADVSLVTDLSVDKAPTGSGVYLSTSLRKVGNSEYRTTTRLTSAGAVQVELVKLSGGVAKTLKTVTVPGLTYQPGASLRVKFQVSGASTVQLMTKVWVAGSAEPATGARRRATVRAR